MSTGMEGRARPLTVIALFSVTIPPGTRTLSMTGPDVPVCLWPGVGLGFPVARVRGWGVSVGPTGTKLSALAVGVGTVAGCPTPDVAVAVAADPCIAVFAGVVGVGGRGPVVGDGGIGVALGCDAPVGTAVTVAVPVGVLVDVADGVAVPVAVAVAVAVAVGVFVLVITGVVAVPVPVGKCVAAVAVAIGVLMPVGVGVLVAVGVGVYLLVAVAVGMLVGLDVTVMDGAFVAVADCDGDGSGPKFVAL